MYQPLITFCPHPAIFTQVLRIFAAAYATNSASQRVLVKAGFRHVGTFRKAFFKNGAFVDGCYYELLKDENE